MPKLADNSAEILARELADKVLQAPETNADRANVLVQIAQVHATLAVVTELRYLRAKVQDVAEALEDRDGHGAGTHLHYISDWLQAMSERR